MSSESVEHFDLITLGTGAGGKLLAWARNSEQFKRCAAIERQWLGGSCPNVACLPSKNVIWSAKVVDLARHGKVFGLPEVLTTYGQNAIDMGAVKKRKDDMVVGMVQFHDLKYQESHTDVIWGEGKFIAPRTVKVGTKDGSTRTLKANTVVVSTGSRAMIPDVEGLKEAKPLTHVEILNLTSLPKHLIVLGAGYVGLEFAQAFRRLGSTVTVIDHHDRVLHKEDDDIVEVLQQVLEQEGVEFRTNVKLVKVTGMSGESVEVHGTAGGQDVLTSGSHILCAAGRLPNTDDIGLKDAGVDVDEHGHIKVDEQCRTTAEGVFAVGDCAGSPHFTHIAVDDFQIVHDGLSGKPSSSSTRRSDRQIPYTLFTDPEFAHVGLRERDAKAQGIKYRLSKLPMFAFLRAQTLGETNGFAKALVSAKDDTILGFSAVGPGAGELLPIVQLVMKRSLPYTDIAELIMAHPTLHEGLWTLFEAVPPRSQ
jgi:pyruvate/2-oxoglutarate dehydrogenase complex dihydrolipoamide dehydrogenase (E3) component